MGHIRDVGHADHPGAHPGLQLGIRISYPMLDPSMVFVQAYSYFAQYYEDQLWMKALVVFIW